MATRHLVSRLVAGVIATALVTPGLGPADVVAEEPTPSSAIATLPTPAPWHGPADADVDKLTTAPDGWSVGTASSGDASYDDFNRTSSDPCWGLGSSGFNWATDGGPPCVGNPAVCKGPSWSFTAEFKINLTTVWSSEYDPDTASWPAPELLTDASEEAANPVVGVSDSQVVALYQRRQSGGNYDIYLQRKSLVGDEYRYGYDRLYRLTSVDGPDGPQSYAYDPVGNRLTRDGGGTTSYTYDRADRILSAGATSITVDANGNLTATGADAFAYDQANRLVSATVGGTTETYAYDGDGTRFSRQVGTGPVTRYVSDTSAGLAALLDDGSRKYVYGVGLAYAVTGAGIEVYHTDRLGSVRALTDGSGAITATYATDEWGNPTASSGTSDQPFGFTGEPRDGSGLTYLRSRYYDPELGRFMSRDTWPGVPAAPQTQDRYAYVGNNPVTSSDPSGHFLDTLVDGAFIVYDLGSLLFGPPKERAGNWLALGADVGSAFVPFVTGGGLIARASLKGADHLDDAIGPIRWVDDAARAPGRGPDFVVTPAGEAIVVPRGAWGPHPPQSGSGFAFTGGSGGTGLDARVVGVRIMDPDVGYPGGRVSYMNASGQTVNPWTGRTISRSDPYAHIPLRP